MKVRSNKEQQRRRLERATKRFLSEGGAINQVDSGVSGADALSGRGHQTALFNTPQNTRTDVSNVAAAIDARKHNKRKPTPSRHTQPRKELVYDDFGEPLRWVWKK